MKLVCFRSTAHSSSNLCLHLHLLLRLRRLSYLWLLGEQLSQIQQREATLKAAILTELLMGDQKVDTYAQGVNWYNLRLSMQQIQALREAVWYIACVHLNYKGEALYI